VVFLLAVGSTVLAQTPASQRLVVNTVASNIKVSIGLKPPEPWVRGLAENSHPVPGATVTFTIVMPNANGPGASFPGNSKSLRVTTDARGDAMARGLRPNPITGGPYWIQVHAEKAQMASPETPVDITAENVLEIQKLVMTPGDVFENNLCKNAPGELRVQVNDDRGNPVVGAEVVFRVPANGPSGVFTGGSLTHSVTTDETGQAVVKEFVPNKMTGDFTVEAVASLLSLRGNVPIPGSNLKRSCPHTGLIVGAIAAAAGAGVAAGLAGKGSSSSNSATTPTPAGSVISIGSGGDPRFGPGH